MLPDRPSVFVAPRPRRDLPDPPPLPSTQIRLSPAILQPLFNLKQRDAAQHLGISLSSLKYACRRIGITRWPGQAGADTDDAQEPPAEQEGADPADDTRSEEEKLEEGEPHPSAVSEVGAWEIERLLAQEGSPGPSGSSTFTEPPVSAASALHPSTGADGVCEEAWICPDWIEDYLRSTDEDEM
ncbi:hypothetical protein GUITHDRAFT_116350 [Guillardia theta CCMP2712]|uniref:RWP-RK domain-containing protein n=1 Tax=Guillardia theta (strain CCMP2712) TaxID=905079 RepID=L1IN70_GUITC|nr:hypothetical protein GUITHDRAFT_116350 [Guillardia theta CCMP2712]EKX37542.1 hypothetical protein GUITHDRAFT_116350 [Guillardia theta CCMP2712]|eukprot:XP_005824522.1 hypothetical protein GUITHDRAFT_116350 [Guillardia theta CCMP2712]